MKNIYLTLGLCITFASCSKKKVEQPKSLSQICSELFPCATVKDSVRFDTITLQSPPQYKVVTQKVVVKGDTIVFTKMDTIYPIPTERIITKTVLKTVLDSALLQTYKDNIYALERRILADDKEIGEQKLTIMKLKGGKRAYILLSIVESILLALVAAFWVYVWKHNKK